MLRQRFHLLGLGEHEQRLELIGVNAMHGPGLGLVHLPYEVRLRAAVRCTSLEQAQQVGQEVEALYLNGPSGGGGVTQSAREVVAVASALVPREAVHTCCQVLES